MVISWCALPGLKGLMLVDLIQMLCASNVEVHTKGHRGIQHRSCHLGSQQLYRASHQLMLLLHIPHNGIQACSAIRAVDVDSHFENAGSPYTRNTAHHAA